MSALTDFERRALVLLVAEAHWLVRPGYFGELLWPKRARGSSSCPYARPAGKLLNRLKARGLAEWVVEERASFREGPKNWGWRATEAGKREAAK
jgi:hypothetical protein